MPKCRPCLGTEAKELLVREFPHLAKKINAIPNCPEPQEIALCPCRGRQPGAKRQQSEYNKFISNCMKSKPIRGKKFGAAAPYMAECAELWRKQQGGRNV